MQPLNVSRHASRFSIGLLVLFTFLLSGCPSGNGGPVPPDFGNNLPPASGPGDVENFFPTTTGSSWNYYATVSNPLAGEPAYFMDAITVTGTHSVGGQLAAVFQESNVSGSGIPASGYFLKNAGGLAYLGSDDIADTVTPSIVPYILALFPVTPGTVAHFGKTGLNFGADLDGDGINETANVTITNTIDGFEPLDLGIGKFARTAKSTEAVNGTVMLSATRVGIPFSGSATRWLAPGIGTLKTVQTTTAQGGQVVVTTVETMEARGYVTSDGVESTPHGFGLPIALASGLADADSNLQNPGAPAVASDGSNFLIVSGNSNVGGAMRGQPTDGQGKLISALQLASGTSPVAAFDGSNYWVVYAANPLSGPGCYAQRITPAGIILDDSPIEVSTTSYCGSKQSVAFAASKGLVVYSRYNMLTYRHEVYGRLVAKDGTFPGDEFQISADANDNLSPALAFDGNNYLVVWEQHSLTYPSVSYLGAARVSEAGALLDAPAIPVSTNAQGQYSPSIVFDGDNYLVTWLDLRAQSGVAIIPHPDIYAARLTQDGVLLDGYAASSGFLVAGGAAQQLYSPYAVYTGTEYLVAWGTLDYNNADGQGIQAARVGTDGTLPAGANKRIVVSGPPSAVTSSRYVYPVTAVGESTGLMVWLDNREMSGTQKAYAGATVAPF